MRSEESNFPDNLRVSDFPALKNIEGSVKTGIYKLVFPENNKGQLLKIKDGEMEGLNTTTLVSDGRFVGTAGLEEIDLDEYSLQLLSKIKSYDYLARKVDDISSRVHGLIGRLEDEYQAKIRNMFSLFKDISRKMPEIINNESYTNLAIANLTNLKIIAGDYFEMQSSDFGRIYSQIFYNQKEINPHINKIYECRSHKVFAALEILVMIEIYEIMLSRCVTARMIRVAKEGLIDRFKPIMGIISSMRAHAERLIEEYDYESKNWHGTYYEHMTYIENINKFKSNLNETYNDTLAITGVIASSLNEELGMDNLNSVYIEFICERKLIEA